jgi:hypothetical protein
MEGGIITSRVEKSRDPILGEFGVDTEAVFLDADAGIGLASFRQSGLPLEGATRKDIIE